MSGAKAVGFGRRSTMGCIIASSGVAHQNGCVKAGLEVELSAAALMFEEKDNFRPYLQLSGDVVGLHGEFPDGVSEMYADGKICSVTYMYGLSDEEIADLALKGLFHEGFSLPDALETSRVMLPGTVDYSHIVANGESVFVVSVPDAHMLHTDSEHSGLQVCDYFLPQAQGSYGRQSSYTSGYYQHVEAGVEVRQEQEAVSYQVPDGMEQAIMPDLSQPVEAEAGVLDTEGMVPEEAHEDLSSSNWIPDVQSEEKAEIEDMASSVVDMLHNSEQFAKLSGVERTETDTKEGSQQAAVAAAREEAQAAAVEEPVKAPVPAPDIDLPGEGMIGPGGAGDGAEFS